MNPRNHDLESLWKTSQRTLSLDDAKQEVTEESSWVSDILPCIPRASRNTIIDGKNLSSCKQWLDEWPAIRQQILDHYKDELLPWRLAWAEWFLLATAHLLGDASIDLNALARGPVGLDLSNYPFSCDALLHYLSQESSPLAMENAELDPGILFPAVMTVEDTLLVYPVGLRITRVKGLSSGLTLHPESLYPMRDDFRQIFEDAVTAAQPFTPQGSALPHFCVRMCLLSSRNKDLLHEEGMKGPSAGGALFLSLLRLFHPSLCDGLAAPKLPLIAASFSLDPKTSSAQAVDHYTRKRERLVDWNRLYPENRVKLFLAAVENQREHITYPPVLLAVGRRSLSDLADLALKPVISENEGDDPKVEETTPDGRAFNVYSRPREGPLPLDAGPYWIQRPLDTRLINEFKDQSQDTESLYLIRAPRKMGKTSLIWRLEEKARARGYAVVLSHFDHFTPGELESETSVIQRLYKDIVDQLSLTPTEVAPPHDVASLDKYIRYQAGRHKRLFWVWDDADALFDRPFRQDFFTKWRSPIEDWNLKGAPITLLVSFALQPRHYIESVGKSVFEGLAITYDLDNISSESARPLARLYGLTIPDKDLQDLWDYLQGHPYLLQCAFLALSLSESAPSRIANVQELLRHATDFIPSGPFYRHLREIAHNIDEYPEVRKALMEVLTNGKCANEKMRDWLYGSGLIASVGRSELRIQCQLYEDFLNNRYMQTVDE